MEVKVEREHEECSGGEDETASQYADAQDWRAEERERAAGREVYTNTRNGGCWGEMRAPKWAVDLRNLLHRVLKRGRGDWFPDRRFETAEKSFWRKAVVCWVCRRRGHMAKRCPDAAESWRKKEEEKRCWTCGLNGHLARECTEDTHKTREEVPVKEVLVGAAWAVVLDGGREPSQPNCPTHHVVAVRGDKQPEEAHDVSGEGDGKVPGELPPGEGGREKKRKKRSGKRRGRKGEVEAEDEGEDNDEPREDVSSGGEEVLAGTGMAVFSEPDQPTCSKHHVVAAQQSEEACEVSGGGDEVPGELYTLPPGGGRWAVWEREEAITGAQIQKEMVGEDLFPMIRSLQPSMAGMITTLLLDKDIDELLEMRRSPELLRWNVDVVIAVLQARRRKEAAPK